MKIHVDSRGNETVRPTTEELLPLYTETVTVDTFSDWSQNYDLAQIFQSPSPVKQRVDAAKIICEFEEERTNRSFARRLLVPQIEDVRQRIEGCIGTSGKPKLYECGNTPRTNVVYNKLRPLSPETERRFAEADFPTLRHFMAELRDAIQATSSKGILEWYNERKDTIEMEVLCQTINRRSGIKKFLDHNPATSPLPVMAASFTTPGSFYSNGINAAFEVALMQRNEFLDQPTLQSIFGGLHHTVELLTKLPMAQFRPLENELHRGEPAPGEALQETSDIRNFWNPDIIWLSGRKGEPTQSLEFSEELFQRMGIMGAANPVMCAGRGPVIAWFQQTYQRILDHYIIPVLPKLNNLATRSLSERFFRQESQS